MTEEEDEARPDEEDDTLTRVTRRRVPAPAPSFSEEPTRRMVRDGALDAAVRAELAAAAADDWDTDIPEDLPELAGTAKMPAHVERRALPFRRLDSGGRQGDPSIAAVRAGGARWARPDGDPSLDVSQLPSALAPRDAPPARRLQQNEEDGTRSLVLAFAVVVLLSLVLLAVAAFGV